MDTKKKEGVSSPAMPITDVVFWGDAWDYWDDLSLNYPRRSNADRFRILCDAPGIVWVLAASDAGRRTLYVGFKSDMPPHVQEKWDSIS